MKQQLVRYTPLISAMCLALGVSACGGGGSDSSGQTSTEGVKTGVFIDAPVKGLTFTSDTQNGTTNAKGEFQYKPGEKVQFRLGDLDLGSAEGGDQVPVSDLPESFSIAKILQSLDTDSEEGVIDISGIAIPQDVRDELKQVLDGEKQINNVLNADSFAKIRQASQAKHGKVPHRNEVISDDKVLEHLEEFLKDKQAPKLTAEMLNQQFIVDRHFLEGRRGPILRFNQDDAKVRFVESYRGVQGKYWASYEKEPWSVDDEGVLTVGDCKVKLLKATDHAFDFTRNCADGERALDSFIRTQPLNVDTLKGKTIKLMVEGESADEAETLVFGDGGQLVITDSKGEENATYKNGKFQNTVVVQTADGELIQLILLRGTVGTGKLVTWAYNASGEFSDLALINASANTWKLKEFEYDNGVHQGGGDKETPKTEAYKATWALVADHFWVGASALEKNGDSAIYRFNTRDRLARLVRTTKQSDQSLTTTYSKLPWEITSEGLLRVGGCEYTITSSNDTSVSVDFSCSQDGQVTRSGSGEMKRAQPLTPNMLEGKTITVSTPSQQGSPEQVQWAFQAKGRVVITDNGQTNNMNYGASSTHHAVIMTTPGGLTSRQLILLNGGLDDGTLMGWAWDASDAFTGMDLYASSGSAWQATPHPRAVENK